MVRSNERNVTADGKTVISTVFYTYDKDGKFVKKRVMSADGEVRTLNFENPEDGNAVLRFEANGKTVTSHSKTDSFGRKVFEELQLGSGFIRYIAVELCGVSGQHFLISQEISFVLYGVTLSGKNTIKNMYYKYNLSRSFYEEK